MLDQRWGWPQCAKCKKPVEFITKQYSTMQRCTIFTLTCHGEKETAVLSDKDLIEASSIQFTTAFNGET